MVSINDGSHGGSQSSFEGQSEASEFEDYWNQLCWSHVCQAQAEAWAAGLDGAGAGGVRSSGCGV
jgi:hypothetical protein